jgi:hypothetical protein
MATVPARAPLSNRRQQYFFITAGCIVALVILVGFSRTYYLKSVFGTPPLTTLVHVHGLLFTGWVVLFITQARLIASQRRSVHMKLGIVGFLLATSMIFVGTVTAITAAKLGRPPGRQDPLVFMAIPLSAMFVFSVLIVAGFLNRRRPDYHKRIMLMATLAILQAAFGRIALMIMGHPFPPLAMGFNDLLIIGTVIYDTITNRRLHPAFLWSAAFVIAMQPIQLIVSRTSAWMTFAQWVTR